jgi:hypothetical protein
VASQAGWIGYCSKDRPAGRRVGAASNHGRAWIWKPNAVQDGGAWASKLFPLNFGSNHSHNERWQAFSLNTTGVPLAVAKLVSGSALARSVAFEHTG